MCRAGTLNPWIRLPILSQHVLSYTDRCQHASNVFGITLGDNDGNLRFPLDALFLMVPLLVVGLKLSRTSFAEVLAALAAAPAQLEEPRGRC